MTAKDSFWHRVIAELERERDVFRLEAHLGKAEMRTRLDAAEQKLFELREQVHALRDHAKESVHTAEARLQVLADEVRTLMARIQEIV